MVTEEEGKKLVKTRGDLSKETPGPGFSDRFTDESQRSKSGK